MLLHTGNEIISIGITGIIGSGKSMLSQVFRSMDIPVYDADKNAKILMNSSREIRERLIAEFGSEVYLDDKINKTYLSKFVFGDESKRQLVNSIVHPVVIDDFINWRAKIGASISAIESAILFEANIAPLLDYTIFVEANREILIKRICLRDNVDENTAAKKIEIQTSISGREKCSVIFTNDRNHSLIEQAHNFINNIRK